MNYQKMCEAADYMRPLLPETPKVGLILGSGLGDLGEKLEEPRRIIPYGEIPALSVLPRPAIRAVLSAAGCRVYRYCVCRAVCTAMRDMISPRWCCRCR